ncbi:MAG: hypothetical protein K2X27_15265 [Candidatus Obscuribacterales bacterium]|nr:hypothetical protein [Candidatus Obscuribacterales bacterium]
MRSASSFKSASLFLAAYLISAFVFPFDSAFSAEPLNPASRQTQSSNLKIASTIPAFKKSNTALYLEKVPRANFSELRGWKMLSHVCLQSDLNSKNAKAGDLVWGLLDDDCRWGGKLVAAHDSLIKGHVVEIKLARTLAASVLSSNRRFKTAACLSIQFDEIVDQDGRSWPVEGRLCRWQSHTEVEGKAPREIEIDKKGNLTRGGDSLTETEKTVFSVAKVVDIVPVPIGWAVNTAALPAAMGLAGAIYPAFVYDKPVDLSQKGVRQRAFVYGFLSSLPGASLVKAFVEKGDNVEFKTGDQLVVDLTFKENQYCSKGKMSVTGTVFK